MKTQKFLAPVLAFLMALSLTGCGSSAASSATANASTGTNSSAEAASSGSQTTAVDDAFKDGPSITMKYAEEGSDSTARYAAAAHLAEILHERSGGKITMELYPNAVMGTAFECVASVEDGQLEMTSFDAGAIMAESLSILDAPGIFSDLDVATKVLTGDNDFMKLVDAEYEKLGVKNLFMAPACYRMLTTTNKKISTVNDIKGLVVRVPNNSMFIEFWKAMGATTQVISASETYLALQQGVVDAQENPLDQCVNVYKFCEVQKYIYNTNHIMAKQCLMMNLDFYNKLPDAYRELLDECVQDYGDYYIQARDTENAALLKDAQTQGAEYIELSDEYFAAQKKISESVLKDVRSLSGDTMVDAALAAISEAAK